MSSAFTSQLRAIAANSTHELDLRARRAAHSESILFSREVAVKQDWETIHTICLDGFRELCQLDGRFKDFDRTLFSAQSKEQDREQMNKAENADLDSAIERCLRLLGSKLLLKPGLRAVEWLIRRFRIHLYNTGALLLAFLPYHEAQAWRNVVSIIPQTEINSEWKFLRPYMGESQNVPRHVLVYAATNNDGFFSALNQNTLQACREGVDHPALMRSWGGITVEAVAGRLGQTRSGRKEVQVQRTEDALLKILPIIVDGFQIENCPDLTLGCFTLAMVMVAKADLGDNVLDSILQAVSQTLKIEGVNHRSALITVSVIISQKQNIALPLSIIDAIADFTRLEEDLQAMVGTYPVLTLVQAIVTGALQTSKSKKIVPRVPFLERTLRFCASLESLNPTGSLILPILTKIISLNTSNEYDDQLWSSLIGMLQRLNEVETIALLITDAAVKSGQDTQQLESILETPLGLITAPISHDLDEMQVDAPATVSDQLNAIISSIPTRTADVSSFLVKKDDRLYSQILEAFHICSSHRDYVQQFQELPIWESSTSPLLLYYSFLIKVASCSAVSTQKTLALQLLTKSLDKQQLLDTQSMLPYLCCNLSDSSHSVRKAAAGALIAMKKACEGADEKTQQLGLQEVYDNAAMDGLVWIPTNHFDIILHQVFMPNIEECVLDASQVGQAIRSALNGHVEDQPLSSSIKSVNLKKSVRNSLFELLTSHTIATPLLSVKIRAIELLDGIQKVGSSHKSKILSPIFEEWFSIDPDTALALAKAENLDSANVDEAISRLVVPQSKDALTSVLSHFMDDKLEKRPHLVSALFERMKAVWKHTKHTDQLSAVELLFELAFSNQKNLALAAQGLLQTATLSSEALAKLAEMSTSEVVQMQSENPPKKRRRTSHGRDSLPPDVSRNMGPAIARLTFVLELIDNSEPEKRPELLVVLFDMLSTLKNLKQQRFESPYLLNLCLSSMLAILDAQKASVKPIDLSSVRVELVTECLRDSDNSQVQNTTLSLSAALASVVPDRMVHNIMPIFTFMGQSMFSKDDEHSVLVINQAIEQIVPVLVSSLRKHSKNMTVSVSNLLASFTAAFDHVPSHRRVSFYQRLLLSMGNEDFAYIAIAMLAVRRDGDSVFMRFVNDVMEDFGAQAQLVTYLHLLELIRETFATESVLTEALFKFNKNTSIEERQKVALILLHTATQVVSSKTLRASTSRVQKLDEADAQALRKALTSALHQTLAAIRERQQNSPEIIMAVKECLDTILELPSLAELLSLLPSLLQETDDQHLKAQALRVLASQFEKHAVKNSRTHTAAIQFLAELTKYLESTVVHSLKQASLICIDRIAESYGRKSPDSIIETANAILSSGVLEIVQANESAELKTQTHGLLCFATIFEILKEAAVPLVPEVMPKATMVLQQTATTDIPSKGQSHNAAITLLTSIFSHVSFMVSEDDLQTLLSELNSSASTASQGSSDTTNRVALIRTMARKTDLDVLVRALTDRMSKSASTASMESISEMLDILSVSIDGAAKSIVTRNAEAVSDLILYFTDLRRIRHESNESFTEIEAATLQAKLNEISIKYVYKLNDKVFRPIFESWIDWVDSPVPTSSLSLADQKTLRQTSLFKLLTHFFNTLKSIVTSYSSYILAPTVEILTRFSTLASSTTTSKTFTLPVSDKDLYESTLLLLTSTFDHDADNFYSAPSHFTPLCAPLISQLHLAALRPLRPLTYSHAIPAVVALATAVLDTPAHHHALSRALTALRHSASPAVRLASVTALHALVDSADVGDDWIANVVGVGAGEGEGARGGGGSVGDTMIYVNEMLEDDDEAVERSVRQWVGKVREKVGEDVFEV